MSIAIVFLKRNLEGVKNAPSKWKLDFTLPFAVKNEKGLKKFLESVSTRWIFHRAYYSFESMHVSIFKTELNLLKS